MEFPWSEAIGAVATILVSIGGAAVAVIRRSDKVESTQEDHRRRIEAIESSAKTQVLFCDQRRDEIIDKVSDKLCSAFKDAIHSTQMKTQAEIAEISKNIALIAKDNASTREDITEIFARLNKRRVGNPNDTGHRRRFSDMVEE